MVMVVVFSLGFLTGHYGLPPGPSLPKGEGQSVDMTNFWATKRFIEEQYPGKVNPQELITGASKGLVEGLGDPYSAYLTPDLVKQLDQELSGSVEGIGVEIGLKGGQPTVIAPLPNSPAARAGIAAGDVIIGVEGQPTQGLTLEEVTKKIRGTKGTKVTIDVKKPGQSQAQTLTLTREELKSPSVTLTYQGDVAIIDVSRFGDDTPAAFDKVTQDILAKKPRGIVLDLRSNPGGFLDGSIDVTSTFLTSGAIVKEQFAHGKTETKNATGDGRLASYPLVVLVNKGTASAAEITAGALRDDRGIKLVGEKTFGKGSVQELKDLEDGAVLKLTIAEWLTPNGVSISKQGLNPDVEVSSDNPEAQLQAAINQLR